MPDNAGKTALGVVSERDVPDVEIQRHPALPFNGVLLLILHDVNACIVRAQGGQRFEACDSIQPSLAEKKNYPALTSREQARPQKQFRVAEEHSPRRT